MIKGVALDLEGTLIDVELAHHRAHIETAREVGVELTIEEAVRTIPSFVGGPDIEVAREIAKRASYQGPSSDILERKRRYYRQFLKEIPIEPRLGVVAVLEQIKEQGLIVSVGSATPRVEGVRLLKAALLESYFTPSLLVFAEDVSSIKPHPEVYQRTAARMGILPTEQLVFEDSPQGVRAAVTAGSTAIAVPTVHTSEFIQQLLTAGAWRVFRTWQEIGFMTVIAALQ